MNEEQRRRFLDRELAYRLGAVETMNLALRVRLAWPEPPPLELYLDGKLFMDGTSNAFTNPAIEAGAIHCRALLSFLGLAVDPKDQERLCAVPQRRRDDLRIDDFQSNNGPLPLVKPAEVGSVFTKAPPNPELPFARVIHIANKGLAHLTLGLEARGNDLRAAETASRGVRLLLANCFYSPLGVEPPKPQILERRRG